MFLSVLKYFKISLENCSIKDQAQLRMLILAILISPFATGIAIGYCLYFFFGNAFLGILTGVFITIMIYLNHSSFLHSQKRISLCIWLVFSIVTSALLTAPIKYIQDADYWIGYMEEENQNLLKESIELYSVRVEELDSKRDEFLQDRKTAAKEYTQTGLTQSLADARRNIEDFEKTYEERKETSRQRSLVETGYQENLDLSRLSGFKFFLSKIINGSIGDRAMFWITFFLFFIIESAPVLVSFALLGGRYNKHLSREETIQIQKDEMVIKVITKDQEEQKVLLNDLDQIPSYSMKKKVYDSLIENYKNSFTSSDELMNRYQVFKAVENGYFDQEIEGVDKYGKDSPIKVQNDNLEEAVNPLSDNSLEEFDIPVIQY